MTPKDRAEILRILEDTENYLDALFESAEWCYREHKKPQDAERFIEELKKEWKNYGD